MHTEEINKARIFIYNVLSLLLVEEHVKQQSSLIIENLKLLEANAFDEDAAMAVQNILNYLAQKPENELYRSYQDLFLVPFGKHVSLSSSQYYEQREAGAMLVKVRDILSKTKIRRDENSFKAPEDHYGFIFTLCSYLIGQEMEQTIKEELHKELFKTVINPFVDQLSFSLMASENEIYVNVGVLLDVFMNFERSFLEVAKVA